MTEYERILKQHSGGELPKESLEHVEKTTTEGVDCVSFDATKLEENHEE